MARGTPKMGLTSWSDLDDPYNFQQLDQNWQIIDFHDHSPGRGVQIPQGGIAPGAVGFVELAAGLPLVPTGAMMMWPTSSVPAGFLFCDGSFQEINQYPALFALIGTIYQTSTPPGGYFQLPSLVQKFPLGVAASGTGSTLGGSGGNIDHTHNLGTVGVTVTIGGESIPVNVTVNIPSLACSGFSQGAHLHNLSAAGGAQIRSITAGVNDYIYSGGDGPAFVSGGHTRIAGLNAVNSGAGGDDVNSSGLMGTTEYGGGFTIAPGAMTTSPTTVDATGTGTFSGTTLSGNTTSGTSGSANPPFLAVNFIIKT